MEAVAAKNWLLEKEDEGMSPLEQYLREVTSVAQWEKMPAVLNISSTKWSRLVGGTDEWPARVVFDLADALQVHWYHDLVVPFGVGATTITLDHAQKAFNAEGMMLSVVDHIA